MQDEVAEITPEDTKHVRKNRLIVILLALLLTVPTVPFLLYRYAVNSNPVTNKTIPFEIRSGQGVSTISKNLVDAGLINSELVFKAYVKLNSLDSNLQAGYYEIPPMTSIVGLADIFQYGRNDITIRYIEGWRVEQLALYLLDTVPDFDYLRFLELARAQEGMLFPDTYLINLDATAEDIFNLLLTTFDDKTADLLANEKLASAGLTVNEAVVLASIVEREALIQADRKKIAGILIKRLREGMRIEADATTQYAIALEKHCMRATCRQEGAVCSPTEEETMCLTAEYPELLKEIKWWPSSLTKYDLDDDSAYNTRKNPGLPPAPISSYSYASLEAVVNHEQTPYYFYLTDNSGVTHYSVTYDQHLAKINQYLN